MNILKFSLRAGTELDHFDASIKMVGSLMITVLAGLHGLLNRILEIAPVGIPKHSSKVARGPVFVVLLIGEANALERGNVASAGHLLIAHTCSSSGCRYIRRTRSP